MLIDIRGLRSSIPILLNVFFVCLHGPFASLVKSRNVKEKKKHIRRLRRKIYISPSHWRGSFYSKISNGHLSHSFATNANISELYLITG